MSILDIKRIRKNYLFYSIFLLIFSLIYEYFSHEVYSLYMLLAFTIPFIYGFVSSFLLKEKDSKEGNSLYNMGIITLSIGSIFKGILDIYGTTNQLVYVYLVVGLLLVALGTIIYMNTKR